MLQITGRENAPSDIIVGVPEERKETVAVLRLDLRSGERTELAAFTATGNISHADGAMLDDRLYFLYDRWRIYALPLSGGEIEQPSISTAQVPGMNQFIAIEEYRGEVYLLMWEGNTYPPAALCRWERESGELVPIVTTGSDFSPRGVLIAGEQYYLFSGKSMLSGELVG